MTIKPIVASTTKRVGTTDAEGNKKETHVVGGQVVGEQSVVIDGHGQSPQRRGEVYDELSRSHRCSPHKSTRSKRRDHPLAHHHHQQHQQHLNNKRERVERDNKHSAVVVNSVGGITNKKCNSPHIVTTAAAAGGSSPLSVTVGGGGGNVTLSVKSTDSLVQPSPKTQTGANQAGANSVKVTEDTFSGYNSGDEHLQPKEAAISVEEWKDRDEEFTKCMMNERGYELKPVEEDGACLFRSISLQIYGDEEMHDVIRQHTMDYIYKNREYFSHFVTEDINSYIKRKRRKDSHGNHIEIQAISEIYSRPVEVYCYKSTPINIFNSEQSNNGYAPLRLSYQRGSHYNAIIDPYNATVGIGLGLAGYKPELQTKEAARLSEQLEIEQTMFEDKLKTTDWEATNEAIEEQIARESYLQWCRDNLHRTRATATASTSSTVTSAEAATTDAEASPSKYSLQHNAGSSTTQAAANAAATASVCAQTSGLSTAMSNMLAFSSMSPKTLSHFAHSHNKKDELNCDSDSTDMSSTSSVGHYVGGSNSPTAAAAKKHQRNKKPKNGRNANMRSIKKRRRDQMMINSTAAAAALSKIDDLLDTVPRKSPKRDANLVPAVAEIVVTSKRANTPDAEQQPCTSKQSNTPEKNIKAIQTSPAKCTTSSSPTASARKSYSSFYQELLEASYATDGLGQLSESEMLQRAIQMSTQDFIEDQKRKYLCRP